MGQNRQLFIDFKEAYDLEEKYYTTLLLNFVYPPN
jgi:hypothetical protein